MTEDNVKEKFEIIHFLDKIRWQDTGSYYLINYAYPNKKDRDERMTEDEGLLTHWIAYITDRQMPFQQIWDKGGLIFSEIVHNYKKSGDIDHLTSFSDDASFIKNPKSGYEFVSNILYSALNDEQQKRLEPYYSNDELKMLQNDQMTVTFKSRFYTDDYLCMIYTLNTLKNEKFDCSFTKYLSLVIKKIADSDEYKTEEKVKFCVLGMAYALHRLTYDIKFKYEDQRITYKETNRKDKTLNVKEFVNDAFDQCAVEHTNAIIGDIFDSDEKKFRNTLEKFFDLDAKGKKRKNKAKFEHMKRTWCSLRDYLKSPQYKMWFKNSICSQLRENKYESLLKELFSNDNNSSNACMWLELPGDVWNENSVFRRCITNEISGKLGALLREEYERLPPSNKVGYPEEFDTTFDFVPRMCEKQNCDVCPFGAIKGKDINKEKAKKLCVNRSGKYCPLVLLYCGYYHECQNDRDMNNNGHNNASDSKNECCVIKKYLKFEESI